MASHCAARSRRLHSCLLALASGPHGARRSLHSASVAAAASATAAPAASATATASASATASAAASAAAAIAASATETSRRSRIPYGATSRGKIRVRGVTVRWPKGTGFLPTTVLKSADPPFCGRGSRPLARCPGYALCSHIDNWLRSNAMDPKFSTATYHYHAAESDCQSKDPVSGGLSRHALDLRFL